MQNIFSKKKHKCFHVHQMDHRCSSATSCSDAEYTRGPTDSIINLDKKNFEKDDLIDIDVVYHYVAHPYPEKQKETNANLIDNILTTETSIDDDKKALKSPINEILGECLFYNSIEQNILKILKDDTLSLRFIVKNEQMITASSATMDKQHFVSEMHSHPHRFFFRSHSKFSCIKQRMQDIFSKKKHKCFHVHQMDHRCPSAKSYNDTEYTRDPTDLIINLDKKNFEKDGLINIDVVYHYVAYPYPEKQKETNANLIDNILTTETSIYDDKKALKKVKSPINEILGEFVSYNSIEQNILKILKDDTLSLRFIVKDNLIKLKYPLCIGQEFALGSLATMISKHKCDYSNLSLNANNTTYLKVMKPSNNSFKFLIKSNINCTSHTSSQMAAKENVESTTTNMNVVISFEIKFKKCVSKSDQSKSLSEKDIKFAIHNLSYNHQNVTTSLHEYQPSLIYKLTDNDAIHAYIHQDHDKVLMIDMPRSNLESVHITSKLYDINGVYMTRD